MNQQYNKELLMFPLEILVFCSLAFGIFKMKKYYPNILFPPQGVTIILPPDEEDMKQINEKDRKAKPIQQLVQVKTLKSEAAHFLQAPFSNELEITMLFIVMLFSHFFIIEMFKIIAELLGYHFIESGMLFYFDVIIIMMIIRNIFNAANIGGYDSQQTKMSISVCVISSLVVILVNIGFQDYLNINIKHEFQREAVHLEIVLRSFFKPGLWSFMSQFGDIFIIFLSLIVSFFIYCILPVLIRFGNCFSEYKNEQNELQAKGKPVDKRVFYFLVFQLILPLFYVASYLKPFTKDIHYVFPFQFCSIIIIAIFQISTYTSELDKHMQKGYQWALILKEQPEMQELVKKKMQGLLRGMVIVSYQLLSKIMIPILLFMILLLRNQSVPAITERYQQLPAQYQENEMYCVKESINVMKYLFEKQEVENEFIDESKIMVKRISNYGFLTKSFIYSLIEFVLFNYNLLTLILTVFYIFFLSKTQAASISKKQKKKKQ